MPSVRQYQESAGLHLLMRVPHQASDFLLPPLARYSTKRCAAGRIADAPVCFPQAWLPL